MKGTWVCSGLRQRGRLEQLRSLDRARLLTQDLTPQNYNYSAHMVGLLYRNERLARDELSSTGAI